MRLKTWLKISSLFFLSGCASLPPEKPSVYLCVIDYPRIEGICEQTGDEGDQSQFHEVSRVPLRNLDKSVCFAPKEWGTHVEYVHLLEEYANRTR